MKTSVSRFWLLGSLLLLAACSRQPASTESAGSSATTPTTAAAPASAPAAASSGSASTGGAVQESTSVDEGADKGEKGLENIAALPASAQLPRGKWVAGTNYLPVSPAQPTNSSAGRVEVVEVFWYACPHCYQLDPFLQAWARNGKPSYVDFVRVPITWGEIHQTHARLFYTLQALGKEEELHSAVFQTIHDKTNMLVGNSEDESLQLQLQFAKAHGISEADFMKAYKSPSVDLDMDRAEEVARRYKVEGVPLIIINGKYTSDVGMAGGDAQLINLINDLAASEHQH
ncbi:MAG: thiol:disulfide interchange protein DsbA/DsbL [Steroidobacteraceae bacterium]